LSYTAEGGHKRLLATEGTKTV